MGAYRISKETNESMLQDWEDSGEAAVCLKCTSEEEMLTLERNAEAAGLVTFIVQDQGRTQIAAGSRTVLAIGPSHISAIDNVCRHLKLY